MFATVMESMLPAKYCSNASSLPDVRVPGSKADGAGVANQA